MSLRAADYFLRGAVFCGGLIWSIGSLFPAPRFPFFPAIAQTLILSENWVDAVRFAPHGV